jgi:hypothetical protein
MSAAPQGAANPYKVGDLFKAWFDGGQDGGRSLIMAILPYTGRHPAWFDCVLRLSAPNTGRGFVEMATDARKVAQQRLARRHGDCKE